MALMQSSAEALAKRVQNHTLGVPPPPRTHPPRDAHHVESESMRQLKITIPKGVKRKIIPSSLESTYTLLHILTHFFFFF
jgi:hypothetical protein